MLAASGMLAVSVVLGFLARIPALAPRLCHTDILVPYRFRYDACALTGDALNDADARLTTLARKRERFDHESLFAVAAGTSDHVRLSL